MFEIYVIVGSIISSGIVLMELIFQKKYTDEYMKEMASYGISVGWLIVGLVLSVLMPILFWPLYLKGLLFPKSEKIGQ